MSLMTFPEHSGFVCLFFYFHFKTRVSCSSGWILTCLALQNDFELLLCVPLPPKNWDAGMHHHGGPHRMLWHLLLIWSFPDSFPYCLAFPLIFIAVIVFSSWLSYVPLGYLFILKQQFLGTNLTLFKSFFFVVGDTSSSEYVFGDMMPLISCNLRSHDFDSPLQYWVHRGDATKPPANWEPGTQMKGPGMTSGSLTINHSLLSSYVLYMTDIDSIPQRRLQGIHCSRGFMYTVLGEI